MSKLEAEQAMQERQGHSSTSLPLSNTQVPANASPEAVSVLRAPTEGQPKRRASHSSLNSTVHSGEKCAEVITSDHPHLSVDSDDEENHVGVVPASDTSV